MSERLNTAVAMIALFAGPIPSLATDYHYYHP
jgi:hypothetical protein